ncbi:Zinc finger protein DZIP1L [Folsomia candida]|uniref:Zinc finger protein DZIP1L n=1 Tax=Folsomia candida TaxID=158441 RepID=A0A226EES4_FOLCA|nr:Zinc finger protein DZIP1L [Folsomia candida]
MKGDRKSVQLINHSHDPHPILPFYFQRRSERLDWRKIASLDLEKVIQNVDTEELDEFVTPILFCRADSEFDENKIDPGFIKVFKLCQLIGEYLSFSRDKGVEKVITLEARCSLLEEQKVKGDEEAGQLRENLTLAKKELKKTKEMLASTQTQLLGSDNLDEVDQCPYCSKTFLAPSLLLAHLQRRHQGLPIPGNLQQNSTGATANVMFPVQLQGSSSTAFSPMKFSSGGSVGLGGTPTVYAFTLSPDGTVTRNQNQLATATNHNLSNISPPFLENNNNFEKRRNSATQTQTQPSSEETVNTMKKKDSECTGGNDQNGNECSPPHSKFLSKTTKSNSDSDPLLLKVIKYPSPAGGNGNDDSDSEKEAPLPSSQAKHQRQRMQEEHHEADETTSSPSLIPSGLDLNTICDLVEKYLEQKSVASQNQHYDKILKSIYNNMDQFHEFAQNRPSSTTTTTQNPQVAFTTKENYLPTFAVSRGEGVAASSSSSRGPSPSGPNARPLTRSDTNVPTAGGNFDDKGGSSSSPDLERIEGNVLRMKDEFETQWTHLSEKIRDSGIEGEVRL